MQNPEQSLPPSAPPESVDVDAIPWMHAGVAAGVAGAATIAVFFLIVDVLAGRAFWTPFALGSAFFLGELPARDAAIEPALVAGYTAMHGAVFVSAGLLASFELLTGRRLPGSSRRKRALVLAALLFFGLEAVFLGFAVFMAPEALAIFGVGRVAFANLLAAASMTAVLRWSAQHRGLGRELRGAR